jgi:Polyketide cyclase / dehydrase and lipid transport
MKTLLKIAVGAVVVVVIGLVGWRYYQAHRAMKAGLLTENISHEGDVWKADFTARIPATETTVFNAIRNIENTHSEQVKAVRIVSQKGNSKTVDMDIAGLGGQTVTTQLVFDYLPDEKKIVYHTANNPLLDTHAEYKLGDEGANTFIDYHETTRLLQPVPVPDGVIKQVIRGVFIAQLEGLKHQLNITTADQSDAGDDEP